MYRIEEVSEDDILRVRPRVDWSDLIDQIEKNLSTKAALAISFDSVDNAVRFVKALRERGRRKPLTFIAVQRGSKVYVKTDI